MKRFLLAAALIAGGCMFAADLTPALAQAGGGAGGGGGGAGGGAGSDVATPQKSAPRSGMEKRDDSMKSGAMGMKKHAKHKKRMKHKKMM